MNSIDTTKRTYDDVAQTLNDAKAKISDNFGEIENQGYVLKNLSIGTRKLNEELREQPGHSHFEKGTYGDDGVRRWF